jgi:hypothetical protein
MTKIGQADERVEHSEMPSLGQQLSSKLGFSMKQKIEDYKTDFNTVLKVF